MSDSPGAQDRGRLRDGQPHLVGRARQIAEFTDARATSAAGLGGCVVFVEAPAGMGKTRLLRVAANDAQADRFAALWARGDELQRGRPFGAVRELFAAALTTLGPDDRARVCSGAAALAAPALAADGGGALSSSESAQHGLYWLMSNLCDLQPRLVLVDDAHQLDLASLEWLHSLARRAPDMALVICIATRPARGERASLLGDIARMDGVRTISLDPLSSDAVHILLEHELGAGPTAGFVEACRTATGGNPLLLRELVRRWRETDSPIDGTGADAVTRLGADAIAPLVRARVSRLDLDARLVLQTLACVRRSPSAALLTRITGLTADRALAAVDRLCAAYLCVGDPEVDFEHPLVREAVYAGMSLQDRTRVHRLAIEAQREAGATDEELAVHCLALAASGDRRIVGILRAAADDAVRRGASDEAIAFLMRAQAEPPPHEEAFAVAFAIATTMAGRHHPDTIEALRTALRLARDAHDRGAVGLELARAHTYRGEDQAATSILLSFEPDLPLNADALRESFALARLVQVQTRVAARSSMLDELAVVRARLTRGDVSLSPQVLAVLGADIALTELSGREAALSAARTALGNGLSAAENIDSPFLYMAASTLFVLDEVDAGERAMSRTIAQAGATGSARAYAMASAFRARARYYQGRLLEAEADARAALDTTVEQTWAMHVPWAAGVLIDVLVDRGDLVEAQHMAEQFDATGSRELMMEQPLAIARARLFVEHKRIAQAIAELRRVEHWEQSWGAQTPALTEWRALIAPLLLAHGSADEARALAAEEVRLARTFGAARQIVGSLRAAAAVADDRVSAVELLREAVQIADGAATRLPLIEAQVDLALALSRVQDESAATVGAAAMASAQHAGALRLVRLLERGRAGRPGPVRGSPAGNDELTAAQYRVARLAADGCSNREIAQRLFLSRKTVEMHLGNAFRRLSISSRQELSHALADGPLAAPEP